MPKIKIETNIKADKRIVFDLSRSIDLHQISTQHTDEKVIDGVTSGLIGLNQLVTWRAKHFRVYQNLTSKITEFEEPDYFVDEMEKGIFKRFRHEHVFKETQNGTLMIDVFDYESPLGFLGRLADKIFLKSYMKKLLEKRNATIKEFAESGKWENLLTYKYYST